MSKFEDTRIVTFKEDYSVDKVDKDGKKVMQDGKALQIIYYKKGSKHAIHFNVVKKLETLGAKMDVEKFDYKDYVKKQKDILAEREAKR